MFFRTSTMALTSNLRHACPSYGSLPNWHHDPTGYIIGSDRPITSVRSHFQSLPFDIQLDILFSGGDQDPIDYDRNRSGGDTAGWANFIWWWREFDQSYPTI